MESHPSVQDLQFGHAESWMLQILNNMDGIPSSLPQRGDWLFFSYLQIVYSTAKKQ